MILGKKVGMTQIFENEKLVPVTVIEAGSGFVVQIKTEEKTDTMRLHWHSEIKEKYATKPEKWII